MMLTMMAEIGNTADILQRNCVGVRGNCKGGPFALEIFPKLLPTAWERLKFNKHSQTKGWRQFEKKNEERLYNAHILGILRI